MHLGNCISFTLCFSTVEWILWVSSLCSPKASVFFFLSDVAYLLVRVDEMQMVEFSQCVRECQVHKGALCSAFEAFAEFGSFSFYPSPPENFDNVDGRMSHKTNSHPMKMFLC